MIKCFENFLKLNKIHGICYIADSPGLTGSVCMAGGIFMKVELVKTWSTTQTRKTTGKMTIYWFERDVEEQETAYISSEK